MRSATRLATPTQNSVAHLISVPFENWNPITRAITSIGPDWQLRFQFQFLLTN